MSTDQDVRVSGRPDTLPEVLRVSPTGRELRDYQWDSCEAVHGEWLGGISNTAAVLATGLGKADILAALAVAEARAGGRALVLVDDKTLVGQIIARCKTHDPSIPVGQAADGRFQPHRPIVVGSRQTIGIDRRRRVMRLPSLVIVDECHTAVSDGYLKILRWAGCLPPVGVSWDDWPGAATATRLLGLTATFARSDDRNLGAVFRTVAIERDVVWGIDNGYLVRPRGRAVVGEHVDTSALKTNKAGDFRDSDMSELGEMVAQDADRIAEAWFESAVDERYPTGRPTVLFAPSVASARTIAAAFIARGVVTAQVYGDTPTSERGSAEAGTGIYGQLASSADPLTVLVSVMVPVKGWDCPPIACVLNARPTQSKVLLAQMVGRGLRPIDEALYPGHPDKLDCLVLDVVGATVGKSVRVLPDLIPGVEYDETAIHLRKCRVCAGFLGRRTPRLIAAGLAKGIEPCSCPCETCEQPGNPCGCPPLVRSEDGGRYKLKGPAIYDDVDLLAASDSAWHWRRTPGGTEFVAAGLMFAVLFAEPDGTYSAGVAEALPGGGAGIDLALNVELDVARAAAEVWLTTDGQAWPTDAAWRLARRRASVQQQRVGRQNGITDPENYTSGGLSDAIDMARAVARFDRKS